MSISYSKPATDADRDAWFATKTTDDLTEGASNLYDSGQATSGLTTLWIRNVSTSTYPVQMINNTAQQWHAYYAVPNAAGPADLHEAVWKGVALAAGTYTLGVHGVTQNNLAIFDWDIGETEVASDDWYSFSIILNVVKETTGIVVADAGLYDITMRADGKNASSSGYNYAITNAWLAKTA